MPVHTPAVYCSSSFRCCSGGEEDVEAAVTTYFCCVEEEEEEVNVDTGTTAFGICSGVETSVASGADY